MKAIICGLGSIGKRHIENLEKGGFKCEDISIYRTNLGTKSFGDDFLKQHNKRHRVYLSLEEALTKEKPSIAFITNPTSLHLHTAIVAAKAGCHLLIEKPLSNNIKDKAKIKHLTQIINSNGIVTHIAYNLRFHPLLKKIKEIVESKKLGEIVSVQSEIAERITKWHPWEKYSVSYASRSDLGGGVIATQSHELDILYWLFGMPSWVFASSRTNAGLPMNVENVCQSILGFKNFTASLHVDYFKFPPQRYLEINGTKGRLRWDYFDGIIKIYFVNKNIPTIIKQPDNFDKNQTFIEEIKVLLNAIKTGNQSKLININEGTDVLSIISATQKSASTGKPLIIVK